MAESIVTPAIRTPLLALDDPTGGSAGRSPIRNPAPTTKDWWLYWDALTRGTNRNTADVAALAAQLDATIRAGTHAERLAEAPAPPEALWIVTDRDNVVYQVQLVAGTPAWAYVAGTMTGSLSELPTDLGPNDINFTFATSDTYEVYRWSGSAWVNQTPANLYQYINGSPNGPQTLTTTATQIGGITLTLTRAGRHAIRGVFDFGAQGAGDEFAILLGQLSADGSLIASPVAVHQSFALPCRSTVAAEWSYTAATAGKVLFLAVLKSAGAGTSVCYRHTSSFSATWIGP